MQEHTIPESLIDQIKAGRAVLVVGAGIGIPSWKQLLEKMNEQLKDREQDGDDAAVKDVARLLSKGSLARATGFLARSLGEEACDAIVAETWATPEELPEVAKALARLPFRHVWTTFPGDLLERAMHAERPDDWPLPEVLTYELTCAISKRQRTLVKILGDFDSYVVTPKSVRNALSSATGLREYAREFYSDGLLLFVGFRFGDPDLSALLDRVFGLFELPAHNHYLIGSGIGPVTVDELENDHHIEAINLPGKGADETAAQSLLEYLTSLERALREAGLTLARSMPDDDDLEGWLALSDHEPEAVREALGRMEAAARGSSDAERLIDILFARVEHTEQSAKGRAALLRELAVLFETEIGDLPQAFTALTMALRQDPADTTAVDEAERLAGDTDGWTELITDVSQVAGEIEDPAVASGYFARLGRWYDQHLDHGDYAVTSYRHALKLDRTQLGAYSGLEEVYRKQQRWGDLADVLADHVELEDDAGQKVDLYLAMGDLCENQLASTARAIEAYQHALELERESDDTLAALERLYRRDERWGKLAEILEQRAAHLDATDSQRAAAIRRELATLRVDKLGDLDGAISKYEAALAADESDIEALRALEGLYDKVGRAGDYLRTLERLADLLPDSEKPTLLRRLAAEIEDKDPRRAIECYERIIAVEGTGTAADDAYRALERLLRAEADWYELVSAYERHVDAVRAPGQRVDLYQQLADVYDKELDDPHRALEAHLSVLELEAENQASLKAGARLYQRTESWQRAIDLLVKHAELEGNRGAGLWLAAGALATEHLGELGMDRAQASKRAETYLEKSLELDPGSHATMVALAILHKARSSWANAVDLLIRAESSTQNRLERVELLVDAATITAEHLGDSERALGLLLSVLELDPERVDVGERAWPALIAAERWKEAIPILEMLARRGEDKLERARARTTLGRAHEALGDYGKAAEHYRAAAEIDRDSLEAALGLASMLFADAKQHMNESAGAMSEELAARWDEVDRTYRDILARHRSGLADSQMVEIWYRLGMSARATGADKKADDAFRRALELEPSHQLALGALIDVAKARGDWKTVVEARREQIDTLKDQPEDKLTLLTEMGDIYHGELKDPPSALGAYLEGLTLHPHSYVLLHKLLNIYTEQGEWRRAVDTLASLAEHEAQAERRSRYRYAAAVIARDEIADVDLAVAQFNLVLDDVPGNGKAFEAIDKLLTERGDYKNLARAYRKMLARVGESAPIESLLPLWTRLGEICLDHLGDLEAAIYAFEVASSLEPESTVRHEQLANLYLESGESRRSEAIFELQVLIHRDPDRVELYRALSNLFRDNGEIDRAFCLAQALVFLGAANAEEAALFAGNRPASFTVARRRITEELWTKSVIHESEDRRVSALFAALIGAIAATTAQPGSAFGLAAGDRARIGRDATRVIARVFKYASDILALDPEPHLYLQPDSQSIKVVNTREDGYLVPSVLVGEPHISAKDERVLVFEVGKRMAYFRPERYVVFALDSLPKLELAYSAALAAAGAGAGAEPGGEIARMASTLEKTVPASVLEQVRLIAGTLADRSGASVLPAWRSATDLTADRVGLILCNDLETAARLVATDTAAMSALTAKDRLRQLLLYSVSESYATVRRHLGLSVGDNR